MVGEMTNNGRIRPSFPVKDLTSNEGSEYGGPVEFTREDVETLLHERIKYKSKYNYKERCENTMDYVKRLRLCIRWFQELELDYAFEQEKLKNAMEMNEKHCADLEVNLKVKEEELNMVIDELRKNFASVQVQLAKEQTEKLAANESLGKEREARIAVESLQAAITEELAKTQGELQTANQRIQAVNDMYKLLQEYNSSLQLYNSKLQGDLDEAHENIKRGEKERTGIVESIGNLKGQFKALQDQLAASKVSQDDVMKQKDELVNEIVSLKVEIQQVKDDRDRHITEIETLQAEATKQNDFKDTINELESKCSVQNKEIEELQDQLVASERKLQVADLSTFEKMNEFEEQKESIMELKGRLEEAELKLIEGEKLRKKLHNTIQELKGNIRVFCRVRPLLSGENSSEEAKTISYPTSLEALGRGIDLLQNGQSHCFTFDKVFVPSASQEDVFVEISQLVQSALDGYKVCIFAYGQTGSGKTYTMMGRPGNPDEKGLIPRCLEQIFQTRQSLRSQGWKYELQVSMLEIYNETIRDLLSTNKEAVRADNGVSPQKYAIKHDASGNTHVVELTVVDVRSSKQVSFLLDHAARNRQVSTAMNEQSSRSHFVFTLKISGFNESTEQQVQGVLNLIDLAGSERLSKSGSTGDRLKETQAINKSLSSLGDVIFALAKKEDHVPFRNSKLTYLLQPCLGGDSKTLMFVNITPEPSSTGESLCSLRFAARVNACEIGTAHRHVNARPLDYRLSLG
ncbi:kinesin-related protein katB [Arabidopsis thaliana]|nr:kinesin-related protein katB [Arabidopsis thaliana]CAB79573.1 kinesin-related protein katB [Arabidopsis thaliana]